ncbi:IS3 family transposase [Bradyrhizobium sp. ORS 375]|uniref:IS3 family transposase n=1 Tax=Bradyrhizobium sp. (strain ORS 375) TaxID=566679 RepID=UPI001585B196|nr:IS3 family transposase [Bradyrhizobium sp. ORS 375]
MWRRRSSRGDIQRASRKVDQLLRTAVLHSVGEELLLAALHLRVELADPGLARRRFWTCREITRIERSRLLGTNCTMPAIGPSPRSEVNTLFSSVAIASGAEVLTGISANDMPFMVSRSNSAIASIIAAISWRLPDSVIRLRASDELTARELRDQIQRICLKHPFYAHRWVTATLRRYKLVAHAQEQVLRLMRQNKLLAQRKTPFLKPSTERPTSVIVVPNLIRVIATSAPDEI